MAAEQSDDGEVTMTPLELFCRQVRSRSSEHRKAVHLLHRNSLSAQLVAILRQELDSLIRVIYLLSLSDRARREKLVRASVDGRHWTADGTRRRITDREMVDLAQRLHGWTESVYRFGCAFVHLSSFHDYRERDPMAAISQNERQAILQHMWHYHGGPHSTKSTFQDLLPYLPMVFEKIADNLECYIKQLEADEELDD